jgi:hypothetical protein
MDLAVPLANQFPQKARRVMTECRVLSTCKQRRRFVSQRRWCAVAYRENSLMNTVKAAVGTEAINRVIADPHRPHLAARHPAPLTLSDRSDPLVSASRNADKATHPQHIDEVCRLIRAIRGCDNSPPTVGWGVLRHPRFVIAHRHKRYARPPLHSRFSQKICRSGTEL